MEITNSETIGLVMILLAMVSAAFAVKIHVSAKPSASADSSDEPGQAQEPASSTENQEDMSDTSPDPALLTTEASEMKSGTYHENAKGDPSKRAILFGINNCDPNVYQGDRLTLRGCVNDSRSMLSYLLKKDFGKVWYNEDADCSIANFLRVWKEATKDIKDGDTLVLQMSRHGMSIGANVLDRTGDDEVKKGEYSGDQGAVMYDGVIVDDCFWRLFLQLPKVKLIYINDSCHSGSQYKVANITLPGKESGYRKARSVGKEYLPKKDNVLDVQQLNKEFPSEGKEQKFDLISISGCQDWETSADAYFNGKYAGAMTYCLLSVLYSSGRKPLSQIGKALSTMLKQRGFEQNPKITVEGDQSLLSKPLF